MAKLIFITGGSRSGKSEHARKLCESLPGPSAFIATCPAVDDEMRERIKMHQVARSRSDWHTIEETIDLVGAMRNAGEFDVVLIDCLTLWVSNLMQQTHEQSDEITEETMAHCCGDLIDACKERAGTVVMVTNEVGMGIVPENAVARRFRDLSGRCNQLIAAAADEVILLVSGLPMNLKEGNSL